MRSSSHSLTQSSSRSAGDSSDSVVLRRFVERRDMMAFEILIKKHGSLVLGVCQRVLGDRGHAEDAFQETFMVLARKAATIKSPHLLGNWLHGTAYRTALKMRRQTQNAVAPIDETLLDGGDDPALQVDKEEERRVIDEEVDRLPERYRTVVVLCYLQGRTNLEAAHLMGCPVGSVSGYLDRAKERLRAALSRRGVAVASAILGAGIFDVPQASAGSGDSLDLSELVRGVMDKVAAKMDQLAASGSLKGLAWKKPPVWKASAKTVYVSLLVSINLLIWGVAAAQCASDIANSTRYLGARIERFSANLFHSASAGKADSEEQEVVSSDGHSCLPDLTKILLLAKQNRDRDG